MTPQEKYAEKLINQYYNLEINFEYNDTEDGACVGTGNMTYYSAVYCALINVSNSMSEHEQTYYPSDRVVFLQKVKQILESKLK